MRAVYDIRNWMPYGITHLSKGCPTINFISSNMCVLYINIIWFAKEYIFYIWKETLGKYVLYIPHRESKKYSWIQMCECPVRVLFTNLRRATPRVMSHRFTYLFKSFDPNKGAAISCLHMCVCIWRLLIMRYARTHPNKFNAFV